MYFKILLTMIVVLFPLAILIIHTAPAGPLRGWRANSLLGMLCAVLAFGVAFIWGAP